MHFSLHILEWIESEFLVKLVSTKIKLVSSKYKGGLATQILVGFFFKGPKKKKKIAAKTKLLTQKNK
jgi:hypothetical protein